MTTPVNRSAAIRSGELLTRSASATLVTGVRSTDDKRTAPNGAEYDLEVVMSTEDVATDLMIVYASAWERDLDVFRRNPVLLWAHDRSPEPAIGNVVWCSVVGRQLVGYIKFHDITQKAREVAECYRRGVMRAVSVGFTVSEMRDAWEGTLTAGETNQGAFYAADRVVLRELSCVNVGADGKATTTGRTLEADAPKAVEIPAEAPTETPAVEPEVKADETPVPTVLSEAVEVSETAISEPSPATPKRSREDAVERLARVHLLALKMAAKPTTSR